MVPMSASSARPVEVPGCPAVSFFKKAFWFCGAEGRAARALRLALERSDDARSLAAVEKHAASLHARLDKAGPTAKALLADLLYFVAWRFLATSDTRRLAETINQLDSLDPSLARVPALRLSLMDALLANADYDGYLNQAEQFVVHSRVADEASTVDLLETLNQVYTRMGAVACDKLMGKLNGQIQSRQAIQTAVALCACATVEDPPSDRNPIPPELLQFSTRMLAGAHLVNAGIAEARGDVENMLASAKAAHGLLPSCPRAGYWLVRANLQAGSPGADAVGAVPDAVLRADEPGERLKLLADLYRDCTMQTLSALAPLLRDERGVPGSAETRLIVKVMRASLAKIPSATTVVNIGTVAELCEALQLKVGQLPWTQVVIACREILLGRAYAAACARLEVPAVRKHPGAVRLMRVAQILRGSPAKPDKAGGDDDVTAIETAFRLLLSRASEGAIVPPQIVLRQLNACKSEILVSHFPDMADVVWMLTAGLRFASGEVAAVRQQLQTHRVSAHAPAWVGWMYARLRMLTDPVVPADRLPIDGDPAESPAADCEPGTPVGLIRENELRFGPQLASGRRALRGGDPDTALRVLRSLAREIDSACLLTDAWWRPLVVYWLAVTHAHMQDEGAASVFESLVGGLRNDEALGQLALLDLQKCDLAAAAQHLERASQPVPSVGYAKALLLSRNGDADGACQMLSSEAMSRCLAGSPYALAAQRLIAAIRARCGHQQDAARLHDEILVAHPDDPITILRRADSATRAAYASFCASGSPEGALYWAGLLERLSPRSKALAAGIDLLQLLLEILTASASESVTPPAKRLVPNQMARAWWRQLAAARCLQLGDPRQARSLLDLGWKTSIPPAVARAQAVLQIWDELAGHVDWFRRKETAEKLEEQALAIQQSDGDNAASRPWRELALIAATLLKDESLPPERWNVLGQWPMSRIARLFDEDPNIRRAAAQDVMAATDGTAHPLLRILIAWAMENDDEFLREYTALEPGLDGLPVNGRDLWVPAALIRFARSDWQGLAGDKLPDCVADMSDPLVCLLVELADARLAVGSLARPSQAISQKMKGIHDNLAALLERLAVQEPAAHGD